MPKGINGFQFKGRLFRLRLGESPRNALIDLNDTETINRERLSIAESVGCASDDIGIITSEGLFVGCDMCFNQAWCNVSNDSENCRGFRKKEY